MMNRSKKQAVLAVLMIVLLLVGAVGGTLAYLKTQTSEVKNVFQPAGVPSEVVETLENNVKTNVQIKNNGNVPAYIRAAIVVTWKDAKGRIAPETPVEKSEDNSNGDYTMSIGGKWTKASDGFYYYKKAVPAGGMTDVLITECKLAEGATAPDGYYLNVEILGQAIQSEGITGMAGVSDAWTQAKKYGSTGN